eukprot:6905741-Ditylum_brightwellii.AAC.1
MDISDLETHFSNLSGIERIDSDSNLNFEIKEDPEQFKEANMVFNANQVTIIAATDIDVAVLGSTSETISENLFVDNSNP